ncbi:hypothetical protein SG34_014085 [Thalassomonas viridans]|uniref:HPr kinase/phosphorylase C-terminal domain-containing protein n=1 Tax=Thalassomonas viridans TaxID=137584 RepID=A0AAE9Z8A5_9GAMM|nr:hypothetical protein [Thalassomonas viridans]WDE07910.1 hypothetical protein SG34_014085 [Thalassomonas viridans]
MPHLTPGNELTAVIDILGNKIRVKASSKMLMETILHLYPGDREQQALTGKEPGQLPVLTLYHIAPPFTALEMPPRFKLEADTLLGASGHNRFIAERSQMQGRAWLCDQMLASPYLLRHQVINSLVYFLLSYQKLTPIHCCAFRIRETTLLCLGASGAGKSTLAMQAYQQGGDILAEDIVFLEIHREKLIARGDCREIHLLRDASRHFPWLSSAKLASSHNGKQKYIVPVSADRKIASSEKFTIVFIEACHKQQQSNLRINNDKKLYKMLIKPTEPGFSLACKTRAKHLEALKQHSCYVLESGNRPDLAFKTLTSLCR